MSERDLGRIQRWMQAIIMHPDGVADGLASAEARQHLDVAPEEVEAVVCRSRALPAVERLAVHSNAYHARLVECLRGEYPVLVRTVGEEVFDSFAIAYLQKYPSRSYTLNELGRNFPRYLAESAELEEDGSQGWADFLIDLATLEWTYNEVFDGPGFEGRTLLTAEPLLTVPPERRWPEARLVFVDCFRLLALRYPVHEVYIRERHPNEKEKRPVISKERVSIADPRTLQERQEVAREFAAQFKVSLPVRVDTIDDKVDLAYSAMPDRIYVIDARGKIAYKGRPGPSGFRVSEVPPVLDKLLGVSLAGTLRFSSRPGGARPERPGFPGMMRDRLHAVLERMGLDEKQSRPVEQAAERKMAAYRDLMRSRRALLSAAR